MPGTGSGTSLKRSKPSRFTQAFTTGRPEPISDAAFEGDQQRFKGVDVGRLGQMEIEAGPAGSAPVLFLSPTGQCDERDVPEIGLLADSARNLVAVHLRHAMSSSNTEGL